MYSLRIQKLGKYTLLLLAVALFLFVQTEGAHAAVDTSNLGQFQATTGLGDEDIRVTIGKIVRAVLGFLGVIAIIIVLYAGFLWMTAGGNEDRVASAKKILIQGVIGLGIILASYSITHFVVTKLASATGTDVSVLGVDGGVGFGGSGGGSGGGGLGLKNFVVKSIAPSGTLPNYNVTIHAVFSDAVDTVSAEKGIAIRKSGATEVVPVTVTVNGNHATVKPHASCGTAEAKGCLEKNTKYIVSVDGGTAGVKSKNGKTLSCGIGSVCTGSFTTGDKLDLQAPTATITNPAKASLVGQGLSVPIEALVSDDLGISLVEFFVDGEVIDTVNVPAGAVLPTNVTTNLWDTSDLSLGSSHSLRVRVYDVDDHSTQSSEVTVKVAPSHCFDGEKTQGTDEIGKDCSPKGGACGVCSGNSCDKDTDCASGICAAPATPGASGNQCVSVPLITAVSPGIGGEAQWITIQGKYFDVQGSVYFIDTADGKNTKIPVAKAQCGTTNTWTDSAIVIEVPKGLAPDKVYPILVETAAGSDATNDDRGPRFKDVFTYKTTSAPVPGICALAPSSEKPGATVTFIGKNLSADISKQVVRFGGKEGTIKPGASVTQFSAVVPNISVGKFYVDVEVNGVKSNAFPFTVLGEGGKPAPSIISLSLDKGPAKQYLTISGKNFGEFQNLVKFVKLDDKLVPTDTMVYGDFSFPKMCAALGTWGDVAIVVKVPQATTGKYHIVVVRTDADNDPSNNESNSAIFEVTSGTPTPGLCAIAPNNGPVGTPATFYGELFGADGGSVTFWKEKSVSIGNNNWSSDKVNVTVPKETTTGLTSLTTSQGSKSNEVLFSIKNCNENKNACGKTEQCCASGSCIPLTDSSTGKPISCGGFNVPEASYTYAFFTGTSKTDPNDFPPAVVEECGGGLLPSPSPWEKHPGGTSVCVNAQVGVKFTIPIEQTTLTVNQGTNSTVQVYKCTGTDGSCATFSDTQVSINGGSVSYTNKADGDGTTTSDRSYYAFSPTSPFDTGATYMVVLAQTITGAKNGMTILPKGNCKGTPAESKGAYCFKFKVAENGSTCTLGSVILTPTKYTVDDYADLQASTNYILDPTGVTTIAPDGTKTTTFSPLVWSSKGIAKGSQCILVNACGADTQWEWSTNQADVAAPTAAAKKCEAYVKVLGESKKILNEKGKTTVGPAIITAKEKTSTLSDTSDITVSYGPPFVLEQCGDAVQSPSPWSSRAGGTSVCINAVANAVFSQVMDPATFTNNSVYIQKCTGAQGKECSELGAALPSVFTVYPQDETHSGVEVKLQNDAFFETNTTYRVGLTTALKNSTGVAMDPNGNCAAGESYCFTFKTRADGTSCAVEKVEVTPTNYHVENLGMVTDKKNNPVLYRGKAIGADQCIVLNGNSYGWTWVHYGQGIYESVTGQSVGTISNTGPEQYMWAKTPTPKDDPSRIVAVTQNQSGLARLAISLEPPAILQTTPVCFESCVTSELGATFSKEIDTQSIRFTFNLGAPPNIFILPCKNESCLFETETDGLVKNALLADAMALTVDISSGAYAEGDGFVYKLVLGHQPLQFNTYYRAFIGVGSHGLRSSEAEGAALIPLSSVPAAAQFPKDKPQYYSWTFKTKADGKPCSISSAVVEPKEVLVNTSGIVRQFAVKAYGSPDECSSTGQALQSSDFSWNWTIADTNVATFLTNTALDTIAVAETPYCTKMCLGKGSQPRGTAVCGDGVVAIGKGEECDDSNAEDGDGCSAKCLHEGSEVLTEGGTCGNGKTESNEDCDGQQGCSTTTCTWLGKDAGLSLCGNGDIGQGEECDGGDFCTSSCLWKGTKVGYAACKAAQQKGSSCVGVTVCGNGTLEPGEDASCEDIAKLVTAGQAEESFFAKICTNSCLSKGNAPKQDGNMFAYCGDGIRQGGKGEACDDGNLISGDGCSQKCQLEGASALYASPSFCGNGKPETGETASCEQAAGGVGVGDGKVDPVQYVKGLNGGTVVDNKRKTAIAASLLGSKITSKVTYTDASYAIQCGYSSNAQCADPLNQGVGTDSCCYPRPMAIAGSEKPTSGSSAICMNALLSLDFSDRMDADSLEQTGTITLKGDVANEAACTSSGGVIGEKYEVNPHDPWYRRAWFSMNNTVRDWFNAAPVYASVACATEIEVALADVQPAGGIGAVTSRVYITPKKLLGKNTKYTVTVTPSGKNTKGVGLKNAFTWHFTTGTNPCLLDQVRVQPHEYMFSKKGPQGAGNFVAVAESKIGGEFQAIFPSNDYKWSWAWNVAKPKHAVLTTSKDSSATVESGPEKGSTLLRASATITVDTLNNPSTANTTIVEGQAVLTNTNCEKPWPNPEVAGYTGFPFADTTTHLSTWYCMGDIPSATTTPSALLPAFTINEVSSAQTPGLLRSLILRNPKNGDAIGIRVHENTNHFSPLAWYNSQGFAGNPKKITIAGYDAVQDETTVYINAINYPFDYVGNPLDAARYTNIYIVSYNPDASEETKQIYQQIIGNIAFNYNIEPAWNVGVCSFSKSLTSKVSPNIACTSSIDCVKGLQAVKSSFDPKTVTCLAINEQLPRDARRLSDLQEIKTHIEVYKNQNGQAPSLEIGSYMPSLSVSTWESWQGSLGKALGTTVPVDPINSFSGNCASLGADATSCWNPKDNTFTCSVGSQVYRYQSLNGKATLKAQLEVVGSNLTSGSTIWKNTDPDLLLDSLYDPSCSSITSKGSGSCGDGVLNGTEVCEKGWKVGTVQLQHACTTADGYTGTYVYDCPKTCQLYTAAEVKSNNVSCVATSFCGDGKKSGAEQCDDGKLNGTYNHCSADCKKLVSDSGKCGDGITQKAQGEVCDVGGTCLFLPQISCNLNAAALGCPMVSSITPKGDGTTTLCFSDTTFSGCVEVPSSKVPTDLKPWKRGACVEGTTVYNTIKENSCNWDCHAYGPHCGDGVKNGPTGVEQCDGNDGAVVTGSCVGGKMVQKCEKTCKLATVSTCVSEAPGGVPLTPEIACGDGKTDKTKGEECDDAASNGAICTALYGSTCTYCSKTCKNITLSGGACGDGVRQVKEECDGTDLQNKTCADFKTGSKSKLVCTNQCAFDKTVCQ